MVSNLMSPSAPDHQHPYLSFLGARGQLGVPLPVMTSQQPGHLSEEPDDAAAWTCL